MIFLFLGVYLHKKVDLGQLRCQVNEMWSQGYRVSSGVISSDTKIVFRSPTAMVYLFIQMSSEMWQFDVHGELYFEKAVDGFLSEMFRRWQRSGSSHEVTIVLFSRCFYRYLIFKTNYNKHFFMKLIIFLSLSIEPNLRMNFPKECRNA